MKSRKSLISKEVPQCNWNMTKILFGFKYQKLLFNLLFKRGGSTFIGSETDSAFITNRKLLAKFWSFLRPRIGSRPRVQVRNQLRNKPCKNGFSAADYRSSNCTSLQNASGPVTKKGVLEAIANSTQGRRILQGQGTSSWLPGIISKEPIGVLLRYSNVITAAKV